jgi:ABC-type branched-subunit amino acid transport system substrate-binding protein
VSGLANYKALVNLVNQNGGIDGHQIDLVVQNDQGSTSIAATSGRTLVGDKVVASLYPGFTGMDDIIAPILNQNHICTIWNIDDTKFLDTSTYPCFYTVFDEGSIEVPAIAKYAKSKGLTRIGVISDTLPVDTVVLPTVQSAAAANGLTITKEVEVPVTAVDASTQISELKGSGAQAIFVNAVGAQAAIFKALQTEGWTSPVLTYLGAVTSAYKSLGSLASQTEFTCGLGIPSGYQPNDEMTKIAAIAKANTPGDPFYGTNAGLTNENILLLAYAIEKYHSASYSAIKNAIDSAQSVSLTSPVWKYSFSSTQHEGFPQAQEHLCLASTPPVDGYPVYNWTYGS